MKLYKFEVESFIAFLDSLKLDHRATRMRTRFKKMLEEKYHYFLEEINEINNNYAVKDDEGNYLLKEERLVFRDNEQRLQELYELANEVIVIEENEENVIVLQTVKESVLNCADTLFEGKDADRYDRFCEIVEQIKS